MLSRTLGNRRSAERLYGRINVHVACTIASELNLAERAIKELDRERGRLLTQLNSDIAAGLAQSTSLETQTRRKEITIKSRGWFALEQALAAARLQIAEAI